jgi:hypothetical protein
MSWSDALRRPAARHGAALALLLGLLFAAPAAHAQFWFGDRPMPEFANQSPSVWLNSKPLTRSDLAGKVVLIEIWTSI